MPNFGHSKFLHLFGENCWKKFGTAIFGNSKFMPVFLGKIVTRNLEWPFLAIPNFFPSFWEKIVGKNSNGHFGHIWCYKTGRNLEWLKLGIPNLFKPFWCKKTGINLEQPKLGIPNLFKPFWCIKTGINLELPKLGIPNLFKPF